MGRTPPQDVGWARLSGPQDSVRRCSGASVGIRSGMLWIIETPPTNGLNFHHGFKKRDCPAEPRAQAVLTLELAPPSHRADELRLAEAQRPCLGLGNGCHTCLAHPTPRTKRGADERNSVPQEVQTAWGRETPPKRGRSGASPLRPPPPMPGP